MNNLLNETLWNIRDYAWSDIDIEIIEDLKKRKSTIDKELEEKTCEVASVYWECGNEWQELVLYEWMRVHEDCMESLQGNI